MFSLDLPTLLPPLPLPLSISPSQLTLLLSPIIYLFLFHLLLFLLPLLTTTTRYTKRTHSPPTTPHLTQSRELLSILHCTSITLLTLAALRQHSSSIFPPAEALIRLHPKSQESGIDAQLPIMTARSEACNALTALEAGYLLADAWILLRIGRARRREGVGLRLGARMGGGKTRGGLVVGWTTAGEVSSTTAIALGHDALKDSVEAHRHLTPIKNSAPTTQADFSPLFTSTSPSPGAKPTPKPPNLNTTTILLLHHTALLLPLLYLHLIYIPTHTHSNAGFGILIITSFLLMNASSPLSSLKYFLRLHHRSHQQQTSSGDAHHSLLSVEGAVSVAYLLVYALCRVGLIHGMLWVFGAQKARWAGAQLPARLEMAQQQDFTPRPYSRRSSGRIGGGGGGGGAATASLPISVAAWTTFWGLRYGWCKVGTGLLLGVNGWWLARGVERLLCKRRGSGREKKRRE